MNYKVTAAQYGNRIDFGIAAENNKQALSIAEKEARNLFDYEGIGDEPTIAVKPIIEKEQ